MKFIDHPQGVARYMAVQALGGPAINHENEIALSECREAFEKACSDPDEEVRTAASDVLADVLHSIKLREAP